MKDTIYRQAAIDAIDEYNACGYVEEPFESLKKALLELPSAQPEIIRCKECKKYDTHDHRCKHWNHGVVVMDWCSRAERREE